MLICYSSKRKLTPLKVWTLPPWKLPMAAVTKHHKQIGLHDRSVLSYSSGGNKSEIKMPAGSHPSEGTGKKLLLAMLLASARFLPCSSMTPSFTSHRPCVHICPLGPHLSLGPHFLLTRTQSFRMGAHPTELILTQSSTKTLFLNKVTFTDTDGDDFHLS